MDKFEQKITDIIKNKISNIFNSIDMKIEEILKIDGSINILNNLISKTVSIDEYTVIIFIEITDVPIKVDTIEINNLFTDVLYSILNKPILELFTIDDNITFERDHITNTILLDNDKEILIIIQKDNLFN